MSRFLIALAVVGATYFFFGHRGGPTGFYGATHDEVIMYSLTTCGNCSLMADELKKEGIAYTEKFIDTQSGVREELNDKLTRAGFAVRAYGTPTLDVHGRMMTDNPGIKAVKRAIGN
jgi:glutaredoxin